MDVGRTRVAVGVDVGVGRIWVAVGVDVSVGRIWVAVGTGVEEGGTGVEVGGFWVGGGGVHVKVGGRWVAVGGRGVKEGVVVHVAVGETPGGVNVAVKVIQGVSVAVEDGCGEGVDVGSWERCVGVKVGEGTWGLGQTIIVGGAGWKRVGRAVPGARSPAVGIAISARAVVR